MFLLLCSGYMSPEYAMKGIFSVKSDVFSFGVLMLEIISGKRNTVTASLALLGIIEQVSYAEGTMLFCNGGICCKKMADETSNNTIFHLKFVLLVGWATFPISKLIQTETLPG